MKPGDLVWTPHGIGTIQEIQPPETEWALYRRRRKQGLIIRFPNGQRGFWYANAVKPLKENEA